MKTPLLLCVALVSISATVQANTGTMRFNGVIADPSCTMQLSASAQELRLSDCPASAGGAVISVKPLGGGEEGNARMGDPVASLAALSGDDPGTEQRGISARYPLRGAQQARLQGDYVVVIDYP